MNITKNNKSVSINCSFSEFSSFLLAMKFFADKCYINENRCRSSLLMSEDFENECYLKGLEVEAENWTYHKEEAIKILDRLVE